MSLHVSVCIPATRAETIGGALRSITRQTYQDWDVLVVGQGPDREIRAAVARQTAAEPRIAYLHLDGRGASKARNAGLRHARGPVVAFMDDDCEAASDWLAVLVRCFAEDPLVGLVGGALAPPEARPPGRIVRTPSVVPHDVTYDPATSPRQPPPGWDWVSANFAITLATVRRVGGFDEALGGGAFFNAAEDTDYKLRLERAGVRMRTTPHAVVCHTHGARVGLREVMRNQRSYARGMGALAAKLTLLGDDRGPEWLENTRQECLRGLPLSPGRAISRRRWRVFRGAYHECLRGYHLDQAGHLRVGQPAGRPA